jgi:predicted phosphoribosyltransferase
LHNIGNYVETSLYYEEFEDISEERIEKLLEDKQ